MSILRAALCAAAVVSACPASAASFYQIDFRTEGFGTTTVANASGPSTSGLNNLVISTRIRSDDPLNDLGGGSFGDAGAFLSYLSTPQGFSFTDRSIVGRFADDVISASACFANTPGAAPPVGFFRSTPGCGTATLSLNDNFSSSSSYSGRVTAVTISLVNGTFAQATTFTSAIPEPSTWALMLAGFGLVGYAMRRRRLAFA